jgi:GT2 family glycosyltransferase
MDWVPSGDLAIRKEIFEQIQGFDEYLITSEDVDICQRVIKTGKVVYSHPKLAFKHLGNPKTLKQFFLKEKWRGEGVLQNSFRHFPKIEINNAIIFGIISFVCILGIPGGIVLWTLYGKDGLFLLSSLGLLTVPLLMTIKTLLKQKQWNNFFILWLLFTVYGLARASSVLNPKVWKKK